MSRLAAQARRLAHAAAPEWVKRMRLERTLRHVDRVHGEPELDELPRLVGRGDLCLDVGANIGMYAVALARLGCKVVAFEPNRAMARHVRRLRGVEVRDLALSSSDGVATLTIPAGETGLATLRPALDHAGPVETFRVPTRRLDGLDFAGVRFIKIDVEGFEEEVLAGAVETIVRDAPLLLIEIEERHNPGGLSRISSLLAERGYRGFFLDAGRWRPVAEFDAGRDQSERSIEALAAGQARRSIHYVNNFLFVPAGRSVPGIH